MANSKMTANVRAESTVSLLTLVTCAPCGHKSQGRFVCSFALFCLVFLLICWFCPQRILVHLCDSFSVIDRDLPNPHPILPTPKYTSPLRFAVSRYSASCGLCGWEHCLCKIQVLNLYSPGNLRFLHLQFFQVYCFSVNAI